MGGLKQGVRESTYISRRVAVGLGSALPRSRLLVKAGSRVLTEVSRHQAGTLQKSPRAESGAASQPIQEEDTDSGPPTVAGSHRAGRQASVHPSAVCLSIYPSALCSLGSRAGLLCPSPIASPVTPAVGAWKSITDIFIYISTFKTKLK